MSERSQFRVLVPLTFQPSKEQMEQSPGLKRMTVSLDNQSVKEVKERQVLYPPAMMRTFLRVRGINDCVEISISRPTYKDLNQVHATGAISLTSKNEEKNKSTTVQPHSLADMSLLEESMSSAFSSDEHDNDTAKGEEMIMFTFTVPQDKAEEYLKRLEELGVGNPEGYGSLSVVPLQLNRRSKTFFADSELEEFIRAKEEEERESRRKEETNVESMLREKINPNKAGEHLKILRNDIRSTIKSRIAVDKVVSLIQGAAKFSFDFLMLVIVASVLAAVGLLTNSSVIIVASMLVSPIMGPILALTFGTLVKDTKMIKTGLRSELAALAICLLVGLLFGLMFAAHSWNNAAFIDDKNNTNSIVPVFWPPEEITSRGHWSAIISGIVVAAFSGIGVALSVLGNNTTSLVGVAISASLLPPVVNCGILLGYAALFPMYFDASRSTKYMVDSQQDLLEMAGISFFLTVLNIILIIISGIIMFRIKEVSKFDRKSDFWATHVAETRKFNELANAPGSQNTNELFKNVKENLYTSDDPIFIDVNNGFDGIFQTKPPKYFFGPAQRRPKARATDGELLPVAVEANENKDESEIRSEKHKLNQALKFMSTRNVRIGKTPEEQV